MGKLEEEKENRARGEERGRRRGGKRRRSEKSLREGGRGE